MTPQVIFYDFHDVISKGGNISVKFPYKQHYVLLEIIMTLSPNIRIFNM